MIQINTQFFTLGMSTGCMRKCYSCEKRLLSYYFPNKPEANFNHEADIPSVHSQNNVTIRSVMTEFQSFDH